MSPFTDLGEYFRAPDEPNQQEAAANVTTSYDNKANVNNDERHVDRRTKVSKN